MYVGLSSVEGAAECHSLWRWEMWLFSQTYSYVGSFESSFFFFFFFYFSIFFNRKTIIASHRGNIQRLSIFRMKGKRPVKGNAKGSFLKLGKVSSVATKRLKTKTKEGLRGFFECYARGGVSRTADLLFIQRDKGPLSSIPASIRCTVMHRHYVYLWFRWNFLVKLCPRNVESEKEFGIWKCYILVGYTKRSGYKIRWGGGGEICVVSDYELECIIAINRSWGFRISH